MKMLIDVRTEEEYAERHAPEAKNLPVEEIVAGNLDFLQEAPRDVHLQLYCRSGGRAERACQALLQYGFAQVTNLGGLQDVEALLLAESQAVPPNRYWFRPARFWKWFAFYYPASRRGWGVTLMLIGIALLLFVWVDSQSHSVSDTLVAFLPWAIALMAVYDLLCFRRGEYPWWWRK